MVAECLGRVLEWARRAGCHGSPPLQPDHIRKAHRDNRFHSPDMDKIIKIILCIFIPPLAVYFHGRTCDIHVLISIVLCFFFWLPGILHAIWYCFIRDGGKIGP